MALVTRFDPFAELRALQERFLGDDFFTASRGAKVPTTDVYTEGDKQLVVEVHLPNFADNEVSVQVDEGVLVISAEHREQSKDDKKYLVRESSSSFYRRIALPDRADEAKIQATFDKGLLKVVVPFEEVPSPKKIQIGHSDAAASGDAQAVKVEEAKEAQPANA